MAVPNSRETLIDYCLRRLGEPVISVAQNLDPDQIEDRVDDSLLFFQDFHFDGVEKVYLSHMITSQNIVDKFIDIPPPVISVTRVVPIDNSSETGNIFNLEYQMRLNDLYTFTSTSIIHYHMMRQHLALLEFEFNVAPSIEFTRHQMKLFIHHNWADLEVGQFLIIECYRILDPNQYTDVWNDRFLKQYTTSLIKRQWGENLKKHTGVILVGGVTLNGQQIYDEAIQEIEKLEQQVQDTYSLPINFEIG
jgi:hypothetical protein